MKPVLLLVDDDEVIQTQMKWSLNSDYDIVSAEDRAGALEAFKRSKPAATLLDLGLPPRPNDADEGLAALSELLAIDETAKIIIVSGQGEKKNALHAVGAGAYDFLCKPIDPDELLRMLAALPRETLPEKRDRALVQIPVAELNMPRRSLHLSEK